MRLRGERSFVKSSQMPEPNAGSMQVTSISASVNDTLFSQTPAKTPPTTPARMPTPPTRGTAFTCIFCGPERS